MPPTTPTDSEIQDQISLAIDNPGLYPGMSFAEGVQQALDWVTGHSDEPPIDPADAHGGLRAD